MCVYEKERVRECVCVYYEFYLHSSPSHIVHNFRNTNTYKLDVQEETMKENSPPNQPTKLNRTEPKQTTFICLYAQCIRIYVKCFNLSTDYFYISLKHANIYTHIAGEARRTQYYYKH